MSIISFLKPVNIKFKLFVCTFLCTVNAVKYVEAPVIQIEQNSNQIFL